MIGAIIGGALALGGAVANGISGSKARKRQENIIAEQERENKQWYDKNYNEIATERADAVSALTQMREIMADRSKNAAGVSAVIGGGNERVAIEKQAQTDALGDTIANITRAGEARKDAIEGQYMATKNDTRNQRMGVQREKMQNITSASQGMINSGINILGSDSDFLNKIKYGKNSTR